MLNIIQQDREDETKTSSTNFNNSPAPPPPEANSYDEKENLKQVLPSQKVPDNICFSPPQADTHSLEASSPEPTVSLKRQKNCTLI